MIEKSEAVKAALSASEDLSDWVEANQPTSCIETGTRRYALTLFAIALEHRAATLLLANYGAMTSAFALARPIYEAFMRGMWAAHCATPEDFELMSRTMGIAKLETVVKVVQKTFPGNDAFKRSRDILWAPLSDYAHGGVRQMTRWMGRDTIEPQYSDEEIVELLGFADMYGLMASMQISAMAGGDDAAYGDRWDALCSGLRARKVASSRPETTVGRVSEK